jgi:hypothetical protein
MSYTQHNSPFNKKGLWANIHAKRKRIAEGSNETMRKPGSKGAPTDKALEESQGPSRMSSPLNSHQGPCWDGWVRDHSKKAKTDGSCVKPKGASRKSALNITEKAYEKQNKKMRSDHKKDTGKTLGDRQTTGKGKRRVSFACRFAGMQGSMTDDNGEPSKLAMALKKWGFSSKGEASSFCNANKES